MSFWKSFSKLEMPQPQEKLYGIQEIYSPPGLIEPEVEFLPKHIKNARVLVWGYNADYTSLNGGFPSKDRVHHHAHTLVANLAADRRLSGTADKPIIFLCHSLGGIIVKRALTYAQTRTAHKVSHDYSIFSCTYGILFFGTPHHGSSPATYANYLQNLGHLTTAGKMSKSDLIKALETESETLQNITDFFVPIMRNFHIYFFWEQLPTPLPGRLGSMYIVKSESAAPTFDDTERAAIAADHREMVRFESPRSQGFRLVMDALLRYCEGAPDVIRHRCVDAARTLGLERNRVAAETLRIAPHFSAGVDMMGLTGLAGLDGFTIVDQSGKFRSIVRAPDDAKAEV
ncbi:hypothetical protein B0T25DRAFT_517710 [Lasiosphaeria hispida]|uniref:DUF676 domain-containing protein n=1 Tax=Lasiosphaeria hispida TaxID=260671 RepID=A0AAJ0HHC4_9PEZI|nr:hypothetical protein B0T25DRAFT_517710 [Lasiosphaeria hispida]